MNNIIVRFRNGGPGHAVTYFAFVWRSKRVRHCQALGREQLGKKKKIITHVSMINGYSCLDSLCFRNLTILFCRACAFALVWIHRLPAKRDRSEVWGKKKPPRCVHFLILSSILFFKPQEYFTALESKLKNLDEIAAQKPQFGLATIELTRNEVRGRVMHAFLQLSDHLNPSQTSFELTLLSTTKSLQMDPFEGSLLDVKLSVSQDFVNALLTSVNRDAAIFKTVFENQVCVDLDIVCGCFVLSFSSS